MLILFCKTPGSDEFPSWHIAGSECVKIKTGQFVNDGAFEMVCWILLGSWAKSYEAGCMNIQGVP